MGKYTKEKHEYDMLTAEWFESRGYIVEVTSGPDISDVVAYHPKQGAFCCTGGVGGQQSGDALRAQPVEILGGHIVAPAGVKIPASVDTEISPVPLVHVDEIIVGTGVVEGISSVGDAWIFGKVYPISR